MEQTLDFLIYGKPPIANGAEAPLDVLAVGGDISPTQGKMFYQLMPLDPPSSASQAYAMMRLDPRTLLLAHVQDPNRQTRYSYLRVPTADIQSLYGDLNPIVQRFATPLEAEPALRLPAPALWTDESRANALQAALDLVEGNMSRLFDILAGAMVAEGLYIKGFNDDTAQRLRLLQGLILLLPAPLRYMFTFSTHAQRLPANRPRLIFGDTDVPTARYTILWGAWEGLSPVPELTDGLAYVRHLRQLWRADMGAFLAQLNALDDIAHSAHLTDEGLGKNADTVAHRHTSDLALDAPDSPLGVPDLLMTLAGNAPPQGELYARYAERLLMLGLEARAQDAFLWVARAMDAQPTLDARLLATLERALESQPDAVYAFVRARLSENDDDTATRERWLARLHRAAHNSLRVALASQDPPTIASWLQLLSREPVRYGVSDILYDGMAQALPLSYAHPALARDMLVMAVKREPSFVVRFLEDEAFCQALPEELQLALFAYDGDVLSELANTARELFLLAVARAIHARASLTLDHVNRLWDVVLNKPNLIITEPYKPSVLWRALLENGRASLPDAGLHHMLTLLLAHGDDETFQGVCATLSAQDALLPVLAPVLHESQRTDDDLLMLVNGMVNFGTLTPQSATNVYIALLEARDWQEKHTHALAEQVARLMAQHSDIKLQEAVLWRLLEQFDDPKQESLAKTITKRILQDLAHYENELELVQSLLRLRKAVAMHTNLKSSLLSWWRDYTRTRTTAHLQKVERAMEGNRSLDDLRAVISTTVSIRKLLGHKTLEEWAQDVGTTFRVLGALSDGFDGDKAIDVLTVRGELDAVLEPLPADARQVLATNLKQLAQLIADMADQRTKPSLMKSDDVLERQLVSGELAPQSAVDLLKWLSGLLDGTQK